MASLTRFVSISPFFSRFSMRDWFDDPDDLQAMVKVRECCRFRSSRARQGPSGRRLRRAKVDSLKELE